MKTYSERANCVAEKIELLQKRRIRNRAILTSSCMVLAVVILAAVLFVPYDTSPPDVSMYRNSPYYGLIQRINAATYQKPRYKNNYEFLTTQMNNVKGEGFLNSGAIMDMAPGAAMPDEAPEMEVGTGTYEEVTDNQVAGVIESDILKRSDKYLFHLNKKVLKIYTIAKEDSALVGAVDVGSVDGMLNTTDLEMYLSQDCSTVTIISNCLSEVDKTAYVCVRSYDVTDPTNIQLSGQVFITCCEPGRFTKLGKTIEISKGQIK